MQQLAPNNLDLDSSSWSISEESFLALVAVIQAKLGIPQTLIEFGSGNSSIRLALEFPQTQIRSIESDPVSLESTALLAQSLLPGQNLSLQHRPLRFQAYGPTEILSYAQDRSWESLQIDCVIIDGPPFYTLRGREACLYQLYNQLVVGGIVILDDYQRRDEQNMVRRWQAVYPDSFELEVIAKGHRLAVLRKVKAVSPHWQAQVLQEAIQTTQHRYQRLQFILQNYQPEKVLKPLLALEKLGISLASISRVLPTMRQTYTEANAAQSSSSLPRAARPLGLWGQGQAWWELLVLLFVKGILGF
ncbi:MAG: class I SAM-dependent methyltransferase [Acaryochloridaceae cyanobacterium SU_2_1]|nr:class I SAM-dependent methyltransferase [Acaryochloridaceae cyanobacterium SU_2_1]